MNLRTTLAAAAAVFALAATAASAADTAKVAQGALQGATAGGVTSFKNIPFAAPPVGDLRWRPPQAPAAWSGVRDATVLGPQCMQMRQVTPDVKESEDCLQLNVWTPANFKPGGKLPVMVFIHGGSFTGGSGTNALYDGTHFAERGVVLVTVNYRLGRLGFFAHPALTAEQPNAPLANYGMMDNLAALKWVQANVAAFGGDPKNVTAFGESAGGILINDLMASPQAKSLFAKAISESGFGRIPGLPMDQAEKVGVTYAGGLGVKGTGPEAMKALRALSAEDLSKAAGQITPILDGKVLPEGPAAAFAAGRELKVPYIAGGNSWEASLLATLTPLDRAGALHDKLVSVYGAPSDLKLVNWDITTESSVIEPDRLLARLHVKNGQKAWVYYDSYIPAAQRATIHGLAHGGELMYVFGNLPDREPAPVAAGTAAAGQCRRDQVSPDRPVGAARQHGTALRDQPLAVFQPAQLFHRTDRDVAVRTDAEKSASRGVRGRRKYPVAQIRLGRGAQSDDRARPGNGIDLAGIDVGGMDQAPARIDRNGVEQQSHWPLLMARQAILDFALLFGDVDVDRARRRRPHQLAQQRHRHRAKRMRCHADLDVRRVGCRVAQLLSEKQEIRQVVQEPPLRRHGRCAAEAARGVQHRQQQQPDPCQPRGGDQPMAHLGRIGVRVSLDVMMQVVKLGHLRVAGLQHLDIELRRHGL